MAKQDLQRKHWTREHDNLLAMYWEEGLAIHVIARTLGRTSYGCYIRARKLKLTSAPPRGYVPINKLAKRCGVAPKTMETILKRADVKLLHSPTIPQPRLYRNSHRTPKYRYYYVDELIGLEAFQQWLETESVFAASRRCKTDWKTLNKWLRAAGYSPPEGYRKCWRLPSSVIDQVVAEKRGNV